MVIDEQKKAVKSIERKVHLLNITVAILALILSFAFLHPQSAARYIFDVLLPILLIGTCFILLYAVLRMRSTIKRIAHAFPNEKLMLVHCFNFVVWSVLVVVLAAIGSAGRKAHSKLEPDVNNEAKLTFWKISYWSFILDFS